LCAYVKALVGGEELGHGAEGGGVGAVVLQRRRRLTHQQAGRHQLGGHLRQLELEELRTAHRTSQHTRYHLESHRHAGLIDYRKKKINKSLH
jgi:hypothetical protein